MESIIRIFNDFIKISLFFFFIYYIFSTEGCECVPGMDTPREVTPSFDAFVLFINAIPDINDINIYTDKNILKKQLEYSGEDYQYIKVPPGNRNIRVTNWADSVLYNTVIELRDKENYTFITYGANLSSGMNKRVLAMAFYDTIVNFSANNAYFRCVHISPDAPQVMFKIQDQYPIQISLPFKTASGFKPTYGGTYTIEVTDPITDSMLVYPLKNVQFEAGKAYNILLKGYFVGTGKKRLQCQVVESNFVKK